jgi:four helix bundle protein
MPVWIAVHGFSCASGADDGFAGSPANDQGRQLARREAAASKMEDGRWEFLAFASLRFTIASQKGWLMRFEELESWKEARQLTREIYTLTRKEELARDFGLRDQIQRAGVSIMSNIAEGFERQHIQEKLQFYNVARGSAAEVRSILYVVEDNYPRVNVEAVAMREKAVQTGKLVTGLIRSTESRKSKIAGVLSSIFHLLSPIS